MTPRRHTPNAGTQSDSTSLRVKDPITQSTSHLCAEETALSPAVLSPSPQSLLGQVSVCITLRRSVKVNPKHRLGSPTHSQEKRRNVFAQRSHSTLTKGRTDVPSRTKKLRPSPHAGRARHLPYQGIPPRPSRHPTSNNPPPSFQSPPSKIKPLLPRQASPPIPSHDPSQTTTAHTPKVRSNRFAVLPRSDIALKSL